MASLTIRNLDNELKGRLRVRAAQRRPSYLNNTGFHCAQDRLHVQLLMQIEESCNLT